ncbi:MAG: acetyl-CoA carboxylase biotin carboxyl carrier protein subunit [Saprospiraceae bacterium]|nr:acetyl-CoA carboxylase biotin carboxyl carrier protein subunit [Saprospiraceae bacterium]
MSDTTMQTSYDIIGLTSLEDTDLASKDIRIVSRKGDNVKLFYDNKSYNAKIKKFDPETKFALINVSGFDFKIKINEPLDMLIQELGFLKASRHSVKEIKSPMPGLVVSIFVSVGQTVTEGEKLLSLEAMKMENIIKSPGDGTIKHIHVSKGNSIDKNQLLIEFE